MTFFIDGKPVTDEEYVEFKRQERAAEEAARAQRWSASEPGKLLKQLGEVFSAYRELVEQDPRIQRLGLEFDEVNQKIFDRMRSRIEQAQSAPRCGYKKYNGLYCRAPKVRGKKYCHMHTAMEESRREKMSLPILGDANGIQVAIQQGAQGVVDGTIDRKQAGVLGYFLQLALSNVKRVDFEEDWEVTEVG